jgi:hypothetical protein
MLPKTSDLVYSIALHGGEDRKLYTNFHTRLVNMAVYNVVKLVVRKAQPILDLKPGLHHAKRVRLKEAYRSLLKYKSKYQRLLAYLRYSKKRRTRAALNKLRVYRHSLKRKIGVYKKFKSDVKKLTRPPKIHCEPSRAVHINLGYDPLLTDKLYQPWFKMIRESGDKGLVLRITSPQDNQIHLVNMQLVDTIYLHLSNSKAPLLAERMALSYRSLVVYNKRRHSSLYRKYKPSANRH